MGEAADAASSSDWEGRGGMSGDCMRVLVAAGRLAASMAGGGAGEREGEGRGGVPGCGPSSIMRSTACARGPVSLALGCMRAYKKYTR